MVITLHGPDAYRRKIKLNEIIARYTERMANLAFEVVDAEDENALVQAKFFLDTQSLFQDSKLVVIKNALSGVNHSYFKKLFKNSAKDKETTLLLSDGIIRIPKALSFLEEKPNLLQEFRKLNNADFKIFIRNEAKKRNLIIENNAFDYLVAAFAGDSWGVVEELNKLSLLKTSDITLEILKKSGISAESDFFSFIATWFRRTTAERLSNLENLFSSRNDAAKIFNVLAYQDQSKLRRFADYDVEIKSGKLEYEEALLELALI